MNKKGWKRIHSKMYKKDKKERKDTWDKKKIIKAKYTNHAHKLEKK